MEMDSDIARIERERAKLQVAARVGMQHIPHYYGDYVRWIFVGIAALLFAGLPFYPEVLPFSTSFEVSMGVVVIILAALTNPHKKWIMIGDAIVSGIAIIVIEIVAVDQFQNSSWILLFFREALVIAFLFALYFSLKTVRSMWLHQLGKEGTRFGEFDDAN